MCADRLFASTDWATSAAQLLEEAGGVVPVRPVVEAVSEQDKLGGKAKRNNPLWLPGEFDWPLQVGTTISSTRVGNWVIQDGSRYSSRPIEKSSEIAYWSIETATTGVTHLDACLDLEKKGKRRLEVAALLINGPRRSARVNRDYQEYKEDTDSELESTDEDSDETAADSDEETVMRKIILSLLKYHYVNLFDWVLN
ncbi:hypothetical protein HDV02_004968 [Globomyces sp. JEL0801]|nr:hypothetical protein HDV02_004968 [Globomyces sp. JEL0801]